MTNFNFDWFSNNIQTWTKFIKPEFKGKPDLNFLEIGSFEGRATLWMLENLLTQKTSKITCVDTFQGSMEHADIDGINNLEARFRANLSTYIDKGQVEVFVGKSQEILPKLFNNKFDFIYIDGSHVAHDVITDATMSWIILKNNGILVFDDYEWNAYKEPYLCPKIAIDSFTSIYKHKIDILHKGYQVIIKKKSE